MLATKRDLADIRLEIEKLRLEANVKIEQTKSSLLKWQIGIGFILAGIMAKGFNWIGF